MSVEHGPTEGGLAAQTDQHSQLAAHQAHLIEAITRHNEANPDKALDAEDLALKLAAVQPGTPVLILPQAIYEVPRAVVATEPPQVETSQQTALVVFAALHHETETIHTPHPKQTEKLALGMAGFDAAIIGTEGIQAYVDKQSADASSAPLGTAARLRRLQRATDELRFLDTPIDTARLEKATRLTEASEDEHLRAIGQQAATAGMGGRRW